MASFQLELETRPTARTDGTVSHSLWVKRQLVDASWVRTDLHKGILIPGVDLQVVIDMPHATGPQRAAKIVAYKDLIWENRNNQTGLFNTTTWNVDMLEAAVVAIIAADSADSFITETLGLTYPVAFAL